MELPKDKEHQVIKYLYGLPLTLQYSELELLLGRSFAFYFVRHPFSRLVSNDGFGYETEKLNFGIYHGSCRVG